MARYGLHWWGNRLNTEAVGSSYFQTAVGAAASGSVLQERLGPQWHLEFLHAPLQIRLVQSIEFCTKGIKQSDPATGTVSGLL